MAINISGINVSGEYRTYKERHDTGDKSVEPFDFAGPGGLLAGAEKLAFTSILAGVAVLGFQVCSCISDALAVTEAVLNGTNHQEDILPGCQLEPVVHVLCIHCCAVELARCNRTVIAAMLRR